MSREFSVLGKSVVRKDAIEKARGEAKYIPDIQLPGMLHAKFLRSPHAHARIVAIDPSKAERLPGVKAVVTAKDTCGDKWGVFKYTQDQQFLPTEKVRYVGALWDRIVAHQELLPLSEAQRVLIRQRLAAHQANPGAARPWSEVRREIEQKVSERGPR